MCVLICTQPLSWASSICSSRSISEFSCPLVSLWVWSMGGTSRSLEGRKNEMELNTFEFVVHFLVGRRLVVVVFLCGGPQLLSGGPLPKLQIFLTFGNTSFICPFSLEGGIHFPLLPAPGVCGLWVFLSLPHLYMPPP